MPTLAINFKGELIEVGDIPEGRGFALKVDGQRVAIAGLTVSQTKAAACYFGEVVTVDATTSRYSESETGE